MRKEENHVRAAVSRRPLVRESSLREWFPACSGLSASGNPSQGSLARAPPPQCCPGGPPTLGSAGSPPAPGRPLPPAPQPACDLHAPSRGTLDTCGSSSSAPHPTASCPQITWLGPPRVVGCSCPHRLPRHTTTPEDTCRAVLRGWPPQQLP